MAAETTNEQREHGGAPHASALVEPSARLRHWRFYLGGAGAKEGENKSRPTDCDAGSANLPLLALRPPSNSGHDL
jgi:hypothetical protein